MYEEKVPKIWLTLCTTVYVVGVVWMAVDAGGEDTGIVVGMAGLFFLLLLAFVSVPLSKYFYNRIVLTPDVLRVGRARIPVAALDPASVSAALHSTRPVPVPPGQKARVVGGGWAVPLGMDSVVLAQRDGALLHIATRDRRAFLAALAQVTGAGRVG
ncbi:hypothetical protein [Streptomyces sp. NPDC047046]|uniref:hypothetical protein n=1 Tax=Streptomyces sp. NPDC047046 TaxID=3155378 RepID=UPI0033D45403